MNSQEVFKLKQEINLLLNERPEYKEFQNNLEMQLKNAGNDNNRMTLLKMLMINNIEILLNSLKELQINYQKIDYNNNLD